MTSSVVSEEDSHRGSVEADAVAGELAGDMSEDSIPPQSIQDLTHLEEFCDFFSKSRIELDGRVLHVEEGLRALEERISSELQKTMTELRDFVESGLKETRAESAKLQRESKVASEHLRAEMRAIRDDVIRELSNLSERPLEPRTPERSRHKEKSEAARLRDDVKDAQKRETEKAETVRLDTFRMEVTHMVTQSHASVEKHLLTEIGASALRLQSAMFELERRMHLSLTAEFKNETRRVQDEFVSRIEALTVTTHAQRDTLDKVVRTVKALAGDIQAVQRAATERAREADEMRQAHEGKINALITQGQRVSSVFHEVEGAIARLEARMDRCLP